jgi:quercetin dioxygenase-like cupin family protein
MSGFDIRREVRVISDDAGSASLPMVEAAGSARALVWPGTGAHMRSMNRITLRPGGRTVPLRHPMEAVYYVISGAAEVHDLETNQRHRVTAGGMFLVDPGTGYRIETQTDMTEIVGGPCPADPRLYDGAGGG